MSFEQMWRELEPVGRSTSSGGYVRQPWTSAEREAREWFLEQCRARDLEVERDAAGNLLAWWRPGSASGPAVLTGSHLDSVVDGGAYDGPLGVVSALAAVDLLRDRGFTPRRPIAVAVFMEEEGSRFGLACLGSRLMTGATTWAEAKELRDRNGVFLLDAIAEDDLFSSLPARADGRSWESLREAGAGPTRPHLRDEVACFVELHVEQGRDLVDRGAAVGVASAIRPHGRYRFSFTGKANHAGTTRMEDRHDPMLTYAMTVLAANKQARLAGQRATFGRVEVLPNGTNAVPSAVTGWLDARAESAEALEALVDQVVRLAQERAGRDGTGVGVTAESVSAEVVFDPGLARSVAELGGTGGGAAWPLLPTYAGHDAGILSTAGVPTAMLFVRNPTGVSHSPEEFAEMADCLAGVEALADTLERLAS